MRHAPRDRRRGHLRRVAWTIWTQLRCVYRGILLGADDPSQRGPLVAGFTLASCRQRQSATNLLADSMYQLLGTTLRARFARVGPP